MLTLDAICHRYNLSTRSRNVLKGEFKSTEHLIEYYKTESNFLAIKNCGEKSSAELIDVVEDLLSKFDYQVNVESASECYTELSEQDKKIFMSYFQNKIEELRSKTLSILEDILGDLNFDSIAQEFINNEKFYKENGFKISNSRIDELIEFKEDIKFILNIILDDRDVGEEIYIKKITNIKEFEIEEVYDEDSGYLYLFKLIDHFIETSDGLNENERYIITNYLQYYEDSELVQLEQVGNALGMTRERVRQIRNKLLDDFDNIFSFVLELTNIFDLQAQYHINATENYLHVENSRAEWINEKEKTNFTPLFVSKIISIISKYKFELLGYELNYHTFQSSRAYPKLKNVFLVKRELLENFDDKRFLEDTFEKIERGIKETHSIGINSYIARYINDFNINEDYKLINKLVPFVKLLLNKELGLIVDGKDMIIFYRNKKRSLKKLCYEALKNLGYSKDGHHLDSIVNTIKELAPQRREKIKKSSIRSTLNNYKNTFVYIGRSSTYGLKSWEHEYSDFKGGTIRDLVEVYLEKYEEPKHISLIAKYVNKYRDTNKGYIKGNINLDESNTFEEFGHDFFGLRNKDYSDINLNFNKVQGGLFTSQALKKILPADYDDLIVQLASENNLRIIQVKSVLEEKIENGSLKINQENIVTLNNSYYEN